MRLDLLELTEFLNKNVDERLNLISTRELFKLMSEQEIAQIITTDRDKRVVNKLTNVLKHENAIQKRFDFTLFIDSLLKPNLPRIRQYILIDILIAMFYRRDDEEKNRTDLSHLISVLLEIKDPILIAYSLRRDNHHRIFLQIHVTDLFNNSAEIELLSISATRTKDLVDKAVSVLDTIPSADSKNMLVKEGFNLGYEPYLATSLEGAFESGGYLNANKIGLILSTILESNGFPSDNPAIDPKIDNLYSGFIQVENLLFTADPKHRDHAFHSFHVFLIGISILALYHELFQILDHWKGEDFLCWVMIAFFHDIGYGIQKIGKVTEKINIHYKSIVSVKPEFSFSESFRLYGEDMLKILNNCLIKNRAFNDLYETIESSLLESWELRDHGLVSALIMLKTIDEYKSKDYKFSDSYPLSRWNDIFIRAGLAIAVHTLPEDRNWKIDIDFVPNMFAAFNIKPYYLSYLLMIIDSIEYLNRPRIVPATEGIAEFKQIQDVKLKLMIRCTYTDSHYLHLKIVASYENYPFIKMMKIAKGIFNRLQHFVSNEWGLTIILQTTNEWENDLFIKMKKAGLLPEKPLIRLVFQKREIEEFKKLFEPKLDEYIAINNVDELYFTFLKVALFDLNINPHYLLKPASREYDILMLKHYISPEIEQEKAKLLNEFFNSSIIDDFIPKSSIGFRDFIKRRSHYR